MPTGLFDVPIDFTGKGQATQEEIDALLKDRGLLTDPVEVVIKRAVPRLAQEGQAQEAQEQEWAAKEEVATVAPPFEITLRISVDIKLCNQLHGAGTAKEG